MPPLTCKTIGQHFDTLVKLDLRDTLSYDAEGLMAIGSGNHQMEELLLQLPPQLLFSEEEIAAEATVFHAFPNLKKLSMHKAEQWLTTDDCPWGVAAIGLACPLLEYLDLSRSRIANKDMLILRTHDQKKLVREGSVVYSNLKELNLDKCLKIGNVGIRRIKLSCPKLIALSLRYCKGIDMSAVRVICEVCKIESLCLSGMGKRLTDDDLDWVAEECPNLKRLDVRDTKATTKGQRKLLKEVGPGLYIDDFFEGYDGSVSVEQRGMNTPPLSFRRSTTEVFRLSESRRNHGRRLEMTPESSNALGLSAESGGSASSVGGGGRGGGEGGVGGGGGGGAAAAAAAGSQTELPGLNARVAAAVEAAGDGACGPNAMLASSNMTAAFMKKKENEKLKEIGTLGKQLDTLGKQPAKIAVVAEATAAETRALLKFQRHAVKH
eukprot:gene11360-27274_t